MSKLVNACAKEQFPDFETMCHYGILTVKQFDTYRTAIREERVDVQRLERSMRDDTLHILLGDDAIRSGWNKGIHECVTCNYVSECSECPNCLNI